MTKKRFSIIDMLTVRFQDFLKHNSYSALDSSVEIQDNIIIFSMQIDRPFFKREADNVIDFLNVDLGLGFSTYSCCSNDKGLEVIFSALYEDYLDKLNKENENESVNKQC